MSKYGIRYAVFAKYNDDGTYTDGCYLSPVAGYNGNPNVASGSDYGDDRSLDAESYVAGGTLSVEFNRDKDELYTFLLGHEQAQSGEIAYNSNDEAPIVGTGAIGRGDGKWTVRFYKQKQCQQRPTSSRIWKYQIQDNRVIIIISGNNCKTKPVPWQLNIVQ